MQYIKYDKAIIFKKKKEDEEDKNKGLQFLYLRESPRR